MVLVIPMAGGRCSAAEHASFDGHIVAESKVVRTRGPENHHVARMVDGRRKAKEQRVVGTSAYQGGLVGSKILP